MEIIIQKVWMVEKLSLSLQHVKFINSAQKYEKGARETNI